MAYRKFRRPFRKSAEQAEIARTSVWARIVPLCVGFRHVEAGRGVPSASISRRLPTAGRAHSCGFVAASGRLAISPSTLRPADATRPLGAVRVLRGGSALEALCRCHGAAPFVGGAIVAACPGGFCVDGRTSASPRWRQLRTQVRVRGSQWTQVDTSTHGALGPAAVEITRSKPPAHQARSQTTRARHRCRARAGQSTVASAQADARYSSIWSKFM